MKWEIKFSHNINQHEFFDELVKIEGYKNFISSIPIQPGHRQKIDKLNIVRTIKGTTGIEGNTVSEKRIDEIVTATDFKKESAKSREELEVLGAKKVLNFIRHEPPKKNLSITEELIRYLHKLTTEDCNYSNNSPGRYRSHNVVTGEYNPPDYKDVDSLMKKFIDLINSREIQRYHPVIKAVLAHFYLISIHPFGDGNGRTSRGLEAYILYNCGNYNALGFYSLANFYYRERDSYINQLQDSRFKYDGDLMEFMNFSLKGLVGEFKIIIDEVGSFYRLLSFQDYIYELMENNVINERIYLCLKLMVKTKLYIPESQFRYGKNELVTAIWKNTGLRTFLRDLKTMKDKKLISSDENNNNIRANIELMDSFSPTSSAE